MSVRRVLPLIALLTPAVSHPVRAQGVANQGGDGLVIRGVATRTTTAVRTDQPPILDGRDDDPVWRSIVPTGGFRQFDPTEDGPPTFETEFRAAYDDHNFYVFVRAYDPHPDSIRALLSRRDVKTNSDAIGVIIDGFHDRRNANEFIVNAAGVKRDGAFYNDVTEDLSWDGVWDVAVQVDDKGWTAEFRIPFSQLRFAASGDNTFGFAVLRENARLNQKDAWPLYRPSVKSIVGQLGTIGGIRSVPAARRVELLPYVVAKSVPDLLAPGLANRSEMTGGLDAKAGLGSNLTVDATINPDFGQVEADPSILNLTAFETRFDERRPFFQEGIGLFRCGPPCDGPFYTRRIGRTPQLRTSANDPVFTSILGAAKLTGRFRAGYTLAALDAVTREEHGVSGATIEPQTNYFVMRASREADGGARQAGIMVTDVRRNLDAQTSPLLRRSATMALVQGITRFGHDGYEVMAYTGYAYVTGSAPAIAATQRSSVHYFQRPDGDEAYDPTRTSLFGGAVGASLKKITGAVKFETFLRNSTPQQEMNDLGLVPTVNDRSIRQTVDYQQRAPSRWFRSSFSQLSAETHWTTGGLPNGRAVQLHTSGSLQNSWSGALTYNANDLGGVNCVACARGGPSLRQSAKQMIRADIIGDPRPVVVPQFAWIAGRSDEGRSSFREIDAGLSFRVATRFSASFTAAFNRGDNDQQWVANYGAFLSDTTHFTFARLDQTTLAVVARANWTATPTLSFQLYAQPFVTAGSYSDWRELAAARAPEYADRFRPYGAGATPGGFNVKEFNSNAVVRWEFRPGSSLFVVWQQGRSEDDVNAGSFDGNRDVRDLFAAPPQNTFLMKMSYWLNP